MFLAWNFHMYIRVVIFLTLILPQCEGFLGIGKAINGIRLQIFPKVFPEAKMKTPEIITYHGYPSEIHSVQTEDGYILEIHRIPPANVSKRNEDNITDPILLIHGLYLTSAFWLLNGENNSLGFLLANDGYDVWMANFRGNSYSQRHVEFSKRSKEFWQFSWTEHGQYDVPAMIDYILKETGKEKVTLIGHSQGTTSTFVTLSSRTQYNDKVKGFISMGPVTDLRSSRSPFTLFYFLLDILKMYSKLSRIYWFPPFGPGLASCRHFPIICNSLNLMFEGVYSSHYNMVYYRGKFQAFDFGSQALNLRHYRKPSPPEFNLSKITAPVAVLWGNKDKLATRKSTFGIVRKLSNVPRVLEFPFNHGDFFYAKRLNTVLYPKIKEILNSWEQQ